MFSLVYDGSEYKVHSTHEITKKDGNVTLLTKHDNKGFLQLIGNDFKTKRLHISLIPFKDLPRNTRLRQLKSSSDHAVYGSRENISDVTWDLSNKLSAKRRLFDSTEKITPHVSLQSINEDHRLESGVLDLQDVPSAQFCPGKKKKPCKQHCCYFCDKLLTNLRKHWRKKHSYEPLVMEALKLASGNGKNHRAFEKLRKLGDEKYNRNKGSLDDVITVRSTFKKGIDSDYVICVKCRGYYVSKNYARHRRLHCLKEDKERNLIGTARVTTSNISEDAHPLLIKEIWPHLRKGKHRDVLFNDPSAIIMGNILCEEQLCKPDPADLYKYVSNQLRLLADLLNIAKSQDPEILELDDLFYPHRYETIIQSIRIRGQFKQGIYKTPYPAMQVCTILTKLCKRLKSLALAKNNETSYKRYERVESLLREQQKSNVTKLAAAAKIAHRRKKIVTLPSTVEVNKLFYVLEKETTEALEKAKSNINLATYGDLAKAIMARILVINRRRPGDVHKTTVKEFESLTRPDEAFLSTLPEGKERNVAANLSRYVTTGKLNKNTANLVTWDMIEAIKFLISCRTKVGIPEENIYLFANPKAKRAPFYRADEALKIICIKHNLNYNNLKATKLRKHLATTTASLDEKTQNIVSDFMGHSYNIHKDIYQIRQVQTDVSVMGQILYDASGIYSSEKPLTVPITNINSMPTEELSTNSEDESSSEEDSQVASKTNPKPCTQSKNNNDKDEHFKIKSVSSKLPCTRTWKTPEKASVRTIFQKYIENEEVPSLKDIQYIFREQGITMSKTILQVQILIRCEIERRKQEKSGYTFQRWTTPQKHKLRKHFCEYYKRTKKNGKLTYPPLYELQKAIATIPEFSNKTANTLRSKLQHEFRRLSVIQQSPSNEVSDTSNNESCSGSDSST